MIKTPDPRSILLIAACLSTLGVLIETTWLLCYVFIFTVLFSAALHAKLLFVVKRIKGLLGIIVFVAMMESIFQSQGTPLLMIGSVSVVTTGGILCGANTLLRMGIVITSASLFTLTTSRIMIQGLIQLKIPYVFSFMTLVALRFLPAFSEEFKDTLTAVQLRGVNLKRIPLKEKLKIYSFILTPVVYIAMDKAQKLSCAMELRAFRAYPKRSSRIHLKLKGIDYAILFSFPLLTAAVLLYNYLLLF